MRFCVKLTLRAAVIVALAGSGSMAGRLTIEHVHYAVPGWPSTMTVTADSLGFLPVRFDFVLEVNPSAAALVSVDPGRMLEDCGWEYFNYRVIDDSVPVLNPRSRSHLITITGVGSADGSVASCYGPDDTVELARLNFLNTNLRDFECEYIPVRFHWRDCSDNTITDAAGATAHGAGELLDAGLGPIAAGELPFPGSGLPPDSCDGVGTSVVYDLTYENGGFDRICVDKSLSDRGDINLNWFRYESADAVVFANYLLYGVAAFEIDVAAQIAETDVNGDGIALTSADFAYLIDIISGDELPVPKTDPNMTRATVAVSTTEAGTTLSLTSEEPIGVAYLRLLSKDGAFVEAQPLVADLACGRIGDTTTALLADVTGSDVLPSGRHDLLRLGRDDVEIASAEIYDAHGQRIATTVSDGLPDRFELNQNYPNPFNPETVISFRLPERSRWTLTILNTLGQTVTSFDGTDNGLVEVIWRGENSAGGQVASGVYYYRLESKGSSRTLPMVLLR